MTDEKIREANCVIAKFMGLNPIASGTLPVGSICYPDIEAGFLRYDSSWDWIMPVWIKFRDLAIVNGHHIALEWIGPLEFYLITSQKPSRFFERLYFAILSYNKQNNL